MKWLLPALLTLALAACSTAPRKPAAPSQGGTTKPHSGTTAGANTGIAKDCSFYAPAQEDTSKRGNYTAGGLYAPGVADTTPDHLPDLECILEPVVTAEPRSAIGNRTPYSVLGKQYRVLDDVSGYVEQGTASYYGNKFHGRRTSNQEVYDMYAFTAAHKTLPLPSFARVTNLDNGQSVIVRVNDRGPFHEGRVIDLSYAAAVKLGITQRGTGRVEVRALTPDTAKEASQLATASRTKTSASSGLDALVQKLPADRATVAAADTKTPANTATRYHVVSAPGQPDNADRFDAWMQANGVRIATGKPAPVAANTSKPASSQAAARATPAPTATATATVPETRTPAPAASAAPDDAVQLQVGSFASRENADKALARLVAAGIGDARLSDVRSNGRVLWRLRVGAVDEARADELAGRIANLGFGQPQRVRE